MENKKYFDELILEKKREASQLQNLIEKQKEEKKIQESIKCGKATVADKEVEFEERKLFDGLISIAIPKTFSYKELDGSYRMFHSQANDINIIFTLGEGFAEDLTIPSYKSQMEAMLHQELKALIKWVEEGFMMLNGHKITYTAFTTPVEADICYNFVFFTKIADQALVVNYNCTGKIVEDWHPVGKGIMNSLKINN